MNSSMFFGVRITRVLSLSFIITVLSDDIAKKAFAPLASLNHPSSYPGNPAPKVRSVGFSSGCSLRSTIVILMTSSLFTVILNIVGDDAFSWSLVSVIGNAIIGIIVSRSTRKTITIIIA